MKKSSEENDEVSAFIIGDPHFKKNYIAEGQDFIERCVDKAAESSPTFIVVLGDILDTHDTANVQPFNLAYDFIERLSDITDVYVLIGNHDLMNNRQILTDNHFFRPLRKFDNVKIVDISPIYVEYSDKSFVFCPYVPPGEFQGALDELIKQGEMWDIVDCIFAHQEFKNCKYGAIISNVGDEWDEDYPPVISGHIHDEQKVGKNIYYPGSSRQLSFGENGKKRVWNVSFTNNEEETFTIDKINLGMKEKRTLNYTIDELTSDIESHIKKIAKKHHIRLKLTGTSEQFKVFRARKLYKEFQALQIKFAYNPVKEDKIDENRKLGREQANFLGVLNELVIRSKDDNIKHAYEEITHQKLGEDTEPFSFSHPSKCPECDNDMYVGCSDECGYAECGECDFQSDFLEEMCSNNIHCECCCGEEDEDVNSDDSN